MSAIDTAEYLVKLAPDFSVLDNIEQYAMQYNRSGYFGYGNIFFCKEYASDDSRDHINISRFVCKLETADSEIDPFQDVTHYYDGEYAIIISKDGFDIPESISYICGVGF